jgi:N-acetylmuramoyl-L-alanine amidase
MKRKLQSKEVCLISYLLLLPLFAWLFTNPCEGAGRPETLLKKADHCRKSLYRSSKKRKYRHNWVNCINLYEKTYKQYPESNEAGWALYRAGRMYEKLYLYSDKDKDLDRSISLFRRVVEEHPKHRVADDAQYRIGEIYYFRKGEPTQAYVEFLKVDIKFPSGDMRPKARDMMDRLSGILIQKERKPDKGEGLSGLTKVKDIRHWSTPTYTRVVIDLARPVKYSSDLLKEAPDLKKPKRLYVDLKDTFVASDMESTIPIGDGLLQRARAGQYTKDTVRVVLDISSIYGYKIFPLHDPFRIVVDVRGKKKSAKKSATAAKARERPVLKGIRKPKQPDSSVSLARQLGLSVKTIVIDPGHGGKDPGCYHKGGIKEKNIVLGLAKILARKIDEKLGCDVFLTRVKDRFLTLEQRTAFANMHKADLFISLHINAHRQKAIHGLETYYLNMATDERAIMVAARENATSEKNISDLETILNDLMLNTKITESSKLAHEVQTGMLSKVRTRHKDVKSLGVKQAPFYVLIGAEMPAVLIETGFMTNGVERKRLLSKRYQEILADGIIAGIDAYIKSIEEAYKGG